VRRSPALAAVASLALVFASVPAHAGWGISVGVGRGPVYVTPYRPAPYFYGGVGYYRPLYAPPPVYVAPPPVYLVTPPPVYARPRAPPSRPLRTPRPRRNRRRRPDVSSPSRSRVRRWPPASEPPTLRTFGVWCWVAALRISKPLIDHGWVAHGRCESRGCTPG